MPQQYRLEGRVCFTRSAELARNRNPAFALYGTEQLIPLRIRKSEVGEASPLASVKKLRHLVVLPITLNPNSNEFGNDRGCSNVAARSPFLENLEESIV